MRIDIWSDVVCPFCYLGIHELAKALDDFKHADQVQIVWHSFQLDPQASATPVSLVQHMKDAYELDEAQITEQNELVAVRAGELGLEFNWKDAQTANSFDAHRLIKFAEELGKGEKVAQGVMAAFFSEGRDVSDHEVLLKIAEAADLDRDEVSSLLAGTRFAEEVHADLSEAISMQIEGVPFFVFENRWAMGGALKASDFLDVLDEVWKQTRKPQFIQLGSGYSGGCGCGGCGCKS